MRIALATVLAAGLAAGLSACASGPQDKTLYLFSGQPCTAEQAAKTSPAVCRTKSAWNVYRSNMAEDDRARQRRFQSGMAAPSFSSSTEASNQ